MIDHPAFLIRSWRPLPELDGKGWHLTHRITGAEVVVVRTPDANKLFAITFATLPVNDTGVAHVLEHMVFRGSQAYPLRRPFAGLLQGSLHTALNATTGPDLTSFHLASQNHADLDHLIAVTLDAVLRPLLREADFDEEGWHLALDGLSSKPRLGGIVLSEMKGHFASPANVLLEDLRRALLPGTVYEHAYGGRPDSIPDLTLADLVAFHSRHYHPSNARLFLWGNHDISARLDQIDHCFSGFAPQDPVSITTPLGPPRTDRPSKAGQGGNASGLMALGWVLPETTGAPEFYRRAFMTRALADGAAAPWPVALRTAGTGRIMPSMPRLDAFRGPVLSLGIEGIGAERPDDAQGLIFAALDRVVRHGFEDGHLERCLDVFELRLRENLSGPRPRGLVVLDRILGPWRHGVDPLDLLDHAPALVHLRASAGQGGAPLREAIRAELLDNPHRVTLWPEPTGVLPDPEADRLAVIAKGLTPAMRRTLARKTAARRRGPEDSAAARRSLPVLSRAELPRHLDRVPIRTAGSVLRMELGEPGIVRADLAIDLTGLPLAALDLVPTLGRLLTQGTAGSNGLLVPEVWSRAGPRGARAGLVLRGKALAEQGADLLDRMGQALAEPFRPEPRTVEAFIQEGIARQQARLRLAGHQMVDLRLRAMTGLAGAMADRLDGLGQLVFLQHLALRLEVAPDQVMDDLRDLRSRFFDPARLTLGLAGMDAAASGERLLAALAEEQGGPGTDSPPQVAGLGCRHEGHEVALPVQAVGLAAELGDAGRLAVGGARIGLCAIATGWLWDAVRVAGGAYGVTARLDSQTGVATFLSFRDPHLLRTLDAFAESGAWLRRMASPELLDRAVVGAVAALDRPLPSDTLALDLLQRHLIGLTDDLRQAELDAVLAARPDDLLGLADALDATIPTGPVVVLGPEVALRAALEERPGAFVLAEEDR
ncbi:insulinase family protein [Rubellimicrobium rubrum]|uniref:insulinase family protein n=1 Tax=Rubellimicrobium rubrum TaxID=2585369 RepID=UPI00159BECE0|nr:insulinase family protein [Rubellimicrobium rubrum]